MSGTLRRKIMIKRQCLEQLSRSFLTLNVKTESCLNELTYKTAKRTWKVKVNETHDTTNIVSFFSAYFFKIYIDLSFQVVTDLVRRKTPHIIRKYSSLGSQVTIRTRLDNAAVHWDLKKRWPDKIQENVCSVKLYQCSPVFTSGFI